MFIILHVTFSFRQTRFCTITTSLMFEAPAIFSFYPPNPPPPPPPPVSSLIELIHPHTHTPCIHPSVLSSKFSLQRCHGLWKTFTHQSSRPRHLHCDHSCVLPMPCASSFPGSTPCQYTQDHPSIWFQPPARRLLFRCKRRSPFQAVGRRRFHPSCPKHRRRPCPTGPDTELRRDHIQRHSGSPGAASRLTGRSLQAKRHQFGLAAMIRY